MRGKSFGAAAREQRKALNDLCEKQLQHYNLLIASNRGPVEHYEKNGEIRQKRGQGGLVTAISSMVEVMETTWIAAPMSEVDRQLAEENDGRLTLELNHHPLTLSYISPSEQEYHWYYDQMANSVLWFLQHNITNPPMHPTFDQAAWEAWEHGYVRVNQLFAERLALEADRSDRPPLFMIHDYHLYLVPGMLRELVPDSVIQHFTHISWPSPESWRQLPHAMRESILTNMLGCDVIGFHCPRYAFNFLLCCQELLGLPIDMENRTVHFEGREVRIRDYPISIDPETLWNFADTPEVLGEELALMKDRPELMILQVARTDPSKNILRSFYAYEQFLVQYPEFHGRVQFLGLLPESRQTTELYKEYLVELKQVASRINDELGSSDWQPICLFMDNNYARGVAAMKHYDILVVNSIADGMNLVAKEGPIVNRKNGVLVISEATGAVDELGECALVVNAFDLVGMANAFHQALTTSEAERDRCHEDLRIAIVKNTIFRWAHDQLVDLLPEGERVRPGTVTLLQGEPSQREVS